MSNFTAKHEKYAVYLQELYKKHRDLDNEISEGYKKLMPDQELVMLKTKNGVCVVKKENNTPAE